MSDGAVEEETMQSEEQVQTPVHATAGTMLRQAREAARIQLHAMAATLKVPQRKLEALEADDYESFPDHVFMRALAMGMCRTLHIDAEPVLALLPQRALKSLAKTPGINETVKVRSHFKSSGTPLGSGTGSSRKIAAGVLVLLAAAAAVYFVPFHQSVDGAEGGVAGAVQPEGGNHSDATDPAAAVPLGQASNNAEAEPTVAEPSAEPVAHGAASVAPATAAVAPEGVTPAAATAAAPASAVATPAASTGALLALKVNTGQSWVKVKDATGKVVLEKTLAKDESATAEGQVPLTVIVGNAKGTQVTVRGEPLDISTTRDNVARFEVK